MTRHLTLATAAATGTLAITAALTSAAVALLDTPIEPTLIVAAVLAALVMIYLDPGAQRRTASDS